jgi:hypothetical protein
MPSRPRIFIGSWKCVRLWLATWWQLVTAISPAVSAGRIFLQHFSAGINIIVLVAPSFVLLF